MTESDESKSIRSDRLLSKSSAFALFLIFTVPLLLLFAPRLNSDGAYYYEYLRSGVCDGDLNFWNEREHHTYRYIPVIWKPRPGTEAVQGYEVNAFSVGPAMSWAPFYIAVRFADSLKSRMTGVPLSDGYGVIYRFSACFSSVIYCFLAIILLPGMLVKIASEKERTASVGLVFLGSMVPAIVFITPAFPHCLSLLCTVLFFRIWMRDKFREEPDLINYSLLGAVSGLMIVTRLQSAVVLLIPLVDFIIAIAREILDGEREKAVHRVKCGITGAVFCLLAASPQFMTFRTIFGEWIANPLGRQGLHWLNPHPFLILFNGLKGLFTVNPILLIAACGLPLIIRHHDKRTGWGLTGLFLSYLYMNSIMHDWAGVGYGMRRFSECLPAFAGGFAAVLWSLRRARLLRRMLLFISAALIPWNFLLMAQYFLSEYGAPYFGMPAWVWPARQFTQAPGLLIELVSSSLFISIFSSSAKCFLIKTALLIAGIVVLLGLTFLAAGSACRRTGRFDRKRKNHVLALSVLLALSIDIWLYHCAADIRKLDAIILTSDFKTKPLHEIHINKNGPYSGQRGELVFNSEVRYVRKEPQYERDRLLAEAELMDNQEFIPVDSDGWLTVAVDSNELYSAVEFVTWLEHAENVKQDEPAAEIEIHGLGDSPKRFLIRAGKETAERLWAPEKVEHSLKNPVVCRFEEDPCGKNPTAAFFCNFKFIKPAKVDYVKIRSLLNSPARFVVSGIALEKSGMKFIRPR